MEDNGRTILHLLGMGVLLAAIALLAQGPPADEQNLARVEFTAADVAQVRATFERTWSRPPTDVELQKAFAHYVRSEVLYREALARGLDRNDPVVRMSLVRKITMLGAAQAQAEKTTDPELEAYFDLRAERYREPATLSLLQVFLNLDRRGAAADADAARLLAQVTNDDPGPEEVMALGDSSMLPSVVMDLSEDEVARRFGEEFRETVVSLPLGQWQGPVESGFGLHLVKILRREESRIPAWTEVRDEVENDLRYEGRQAAEDQFYAEVLPRYQIVFDEAITTAFEGQGEAAAISGK